MIIEAGGYLKWWTRAFKFSVEGLGFWTGLRTECWKYTERPTGETELYDTKTDPNEK